jgi:hypothetical protein
MKKFESMDYHPTSEKLVTILQDHTQRDDSLFFRILVGYYFSLAASHMRCIIDSPDLGETPVNMYALNLAPSGYGKTMGTNLMEEHVLNEFRQRFLDETFPILAERNLPKIAIKRANRKSTDPDEELERVIREFDRLGHLAFSFDSGTSPAVKQMRHMLLMANAGSMNLIMDEVGANLTSNMEVFDTFIELFDKGLIKQKLVKNTVDSARSEEIIGKTPANLLMFGVPNRLLDGAKSEDALMTMLSQGYARRCFFGYVKSSSRKNNRTPEQMFNDRTSKVNDTFLTQLAGRLNNLADIVNANKRLKISKDTCIILNEYQLNCENRADLLPEHQEIQKRELSERSFKVLKLAGAYAFIDDSIEVTEDHINNAIKLAEDSGDAFNLLLARDKPWVKLAKYIAEVGNDVTQADLSEDLPFYKGPLGYKQELLTLATAYGYKNNIIIKKSFADGIEFLRGETLKEANHNKIAISYSTDITKDYINDYAPFDKLHQLTQKDGLHWLNHHLKGGYRNEENAIPGFSLLVLDVDGTVNLSTAKLLLKDYKAMYYTTKRHTDAENRFRILLPINYELTLDQRDYREFYKNVLEWLPFDVDEQCGQRCRKWLSHAGHYEYTDGEVFDALPFIPKTSKNEERKAILNSQQSMDNLERWVTNNIGDGNRNNMLLRYSMILVDAGFSYDAIKSRVTDLNNKIADGLDEVELFSTIFVTVSKTLATKKDEKHND